MGFLDSYTPLAMTRAGLAQGGFEGNASGMARFLH
jgi:hypothetical protein